MSDIPNDEAKIAELDNWVLVNGSIRRALRAAIDYGRETRSESASRDQVIEECAKEVLCLWKESPNEAPDYTQNKISHGCIAAALHLRAIKQRDISSENK